MPHERTSQACQFDVTPGPICFIIAFGMQALCALWNSAVFHSVVCPVASGVDQLSILASCASLVVDMCKPRSGCLQAS